MSGRKDSTSLSVNYSHVNLHYGVVGVLWPRSSEVEGDCHLHTYYPGDPWCHRRPVRDLTGVVFRNSTRTVEGDEYTPENYWGKGPLQRTKRIRCYWNLRGGKINSYFTNRDESGFQNFGNPHGREDFKFPLEVVLLVLYFKVPLLPSVLGPIYPHN